MAEDKLSYWGVPIDNQWLCDTTSLAIGYVHTRETWRFRDLVMSYTQDQTTDVWMYLTTLLMSARKVSDPAEDGITPDASDIEYVRSLFSFLSDDVESLRIWFLVESAVKEDRASVAAQLWLLRSLDDRKYVDTMHMMVQSAHHLISGSRMHTRYIMRSALLRLMISRAARYIRQHNWHSDDLNAAADLALLLDDRRIVIPVDDQIDGTQ